MSYCQSELIANIAELSESNARLSVDHSSTAAPLSEADLCYPDLDESPPPLFFGRCCSKLILSLFHLPEAEESSFILPLSIL